MITITWPPSFPLTLWLLLLVSWYVLGQSLGQQHLMVPQNSTVNFHLAQMGSNPCEKVPLTPSLWFHLEMNSYLDNYPGGFHMSLQEYSSNVGATDFCLGVGAHPNAGQLCEAVEGRDWYALAAVENWNSFVNILYDSAGYAFEIISGVIPAMLIDFEKDPTRIYGTVASYIGLVTTWVSCFPGVMFSTWSPIVSTMFDSIGEITWISFVGVMYVTTALAFIDSVILVGQGEDRFTRSADIATMVAESQRVVQSTISNITQTVINSPITLPQGLSGINRDGSFLNEVPTNFQNQLQRQLELALKLKSLAKFWRVQNAFVVRGSDPCIYSGVNGAFEDADRISSCGEDNIMMNIVRAEKGGKGFDPTIYHASLVQSKYGFSAEFLTNSAWRCQLKSGVFEYDSCLLTNDTTPLRLRDFSLPEECYFNLPVCDLTKPGLQDLRRNRKKTITQLCRMQGLPI